jgi:anti-sigma28 factor (negative regulator of flagellin synthesis)
MISQLNSAAIRNSYQSAFGEARETTKKEATNISKQGDTSKVEQLKDAVNSGEYKVNLQALSKKIAEELL